MVSKRNRQKINNNWWLIRVTLVVAFSFCPKFLGGGEDLRLVLCCYMNAGWVMGIPWGCGDTQTISAVTYLVWTYCTQRGDRDKKFLGISTRTLGTWWWAHLPWTLHSKETWWNFYSLIFDFNNLIFIAAKVFVNEHHSTQTNQFKSEYFTCHQLKISTLNFTTWRSKTTWLRHYMLLKLVFYSSSKERYQKRTG